MKKSFLLFFLLIQTLHVFAQDVYKTPSGARYHLSSCRMVENVSSKLVGLDAINASKLTPCKICKPPAKSNLQKQLTSQDKSVGTSKSVQCKGITQKGKRCKHQTRLANGYCFQHTKQNSSRAISSKNKSKNSKKSTTPTCGAKTQSGKRCRRKVKGGGYCYQHK